MYVCVLENPFFPSNLKAPFALAVSRLYDTSTKENVTPGTATDKHYSINFSPG